MTLAEWERLRAEAYDEWIEAERAADAASRAVRAAAERVADALGRMRWVAAQRERIE